MDAARLDAARAALAQHCANNDALAADRQLAHPRPRGLAITLGSLAGLALLMTPGMIGLALFSRDRQILLVMASLSAAAAVLLILASTYTLRRDRRLAEADRGDPRATLETYVTSLRSGAPGEALSRLCPDTRQSTVEAPPIGPHRGRKAYRLDNLQAMSDWCKTFARSDASQPRWMFIRDLSFERLDGDLAIVRLRCELRWWPLWGALAIAIMALPMLFFALIPGLLLYLALMQRQPVVVSKHLLLGADGRWYVVAAEILPNEL